MVESMHALAPPSPRRPPKPRLPHPHLAPPLPSRTAVEPVEAATPSAESWTPAAVPMARPAGRPRRRPGPHTLAERTLRNALRFGFFVNGFSLLVPRVLPAGSFDAWRYDGGDFLLAAAVLLSGHALLMLGRRSAPPEG